jgi:ABC-type uncharacterized transport system involved in gliding motility auxiliary subunit
MATIRLNKQIEGLLFSTVGVIVMFIVLVAVYVIASVAKERIDLTKERLFTLSDGTKAILKKLDTPVEIRLYRTQSAKEMPVFLSTYADRVEDLLSEYKKTAGSNLEIKKLNPEPDSDAEDSANLDGVEGQTLQLGGEKVYLGLAVSCLDAKVAIPFLAPDREKLLEYDISRAIARVVTPAKPVLGLMSGLPIMGEFNPMMMRMGQMSRSDPWIIVSELRKDFQVKEIQVQAEQIDEEVKVLIVIHPKNLSEKTQYAIDQFVLRGGKLLAFLDPLSIVDVRNQPGQNPLQAAASATGSTLDKLLKAWGIEFDKDKVVADLRFKTILGGRGGQPTVNPAFLSLTPQGIDQSDPALGQIDSLLVPFAGVFTGTPMEGLKQTVLLRTSKESQLIDRFMAEFAGENTVRDFQSSGKEYALAIRLTGRFKTAFPDGKPKDTSADKDKDKKETPPTSEGESLKQSKSETVVVLMGDTDFMWDQVAAQVQEFFGQKIVIPRAGNLALVQNLVEQLSGDNNLISVRSRATMNRPFTVVKEMQAQAEERYQKKLKELEDALSETQRKLNELQQTKKEAGQRFILSPEQQAEIRKFQQKQVEVKKERKQVRKDLQREITSLETRIKWINIAGMPLLVTIGGVTLAMIKKKRTAAR